MKIKKNILDTTDIFKMLGCKKFKEFILLDNIDTNLCDFVLRTKLYIYYIIKRGNIFVVCRCTKINKFCVSVGIGVL